MTDKQTFIVPARKGKAARLRKGQSIKVINTYGSQVVDTWAFNAKDPSEYMSMEHTRGVLDKMYPQPGEAFMTNHRRPILTIVEDTTPGIHDTLIAACDRYRYQLLGVKDFHDSCTDNLAAALAELGVKATHTPSPFNMFMIREWGDGLELTRRPPKSRPGDYVVLRAEVDCVVAFSACPQDIVETNGPDCTPRDVECQVL
jgi:uncharacterized protein YcgI (DUF1989 family)